MHELWASRLAQCGRCCAAAPISPPPLRCGPSWPRRSYPSRAGCHRARFLRRFRRQADRRAQRDRPPGAAARHTAAARRRTTARLRRSVLPRERRVHARGHTRSVSAPVRAVHRALRSARRLHPAGRRPARGHRGDCRRRRRARRRPVADGARAGRGHVHSAAVLRSGILGARARRRTRRNGDLAVRHAPFAPRSRRRGCAARRRGAPPAGSNLVPAWRSPPRRERSRVR